MNEHGDQPDRGLALPCPKVSKGSYDEHLVRLHPSMTIAISVQRLVSVVGQLPSLLNLRVKTPAK